MSYEGFAYLYDELMIDAPYDDWSDFVSEKLAKYQIAHKDLLDLACGTGELSVRFARKGFEVTGVDLSSDMLTVANDKAEREGLSIRFFQQNMAELEGIGKYGVVGIFCDSLNYLQTEEEVLQTFHKVHEHIKDDGLFVFDVHSIYKINEVFADETYTLSDEKLSYIWNCFKGEFPNSVEHELSFFVLEEETGKYDRVDELHFQRTYSLEQYTAWLTDAGFELLEVVADFHHTDLAHDSERIFFVARKSK
ncbi:MULTISPECIES: class I SAM-dependent methyltransferase [unclassified Bacillus (in: firmicutes)]|uniref:class I SAM-dependent DNA methyltransferase n=1 Tax=unclassified Bacillus (in: firmicutes) TaxID=185979 RepID=UPI0008EC1806|nr:MULTISPECIES: class I SAM-dependent methyltransferase [unclassified Bacillus (in: firmicutes)]SFA95337.1 Methyltransferase domain-containing protein [Bacillus sp. UNCCL13]SFQ79038.1 Methyltransferase domain-containing protein [Bacillus sp. cl95]